VDDASKDKTSAAVKKYQRKLGRKLILIRQQKNQGVGGAIITGYKKSVEENVDIAVVMAGDAQMDPRDLPTLIMPIIRNEADYVKGNRLFTGEAWQKIPKLRYFGNSLLSLLTKVASGYWHVADSQCGYTAASANVLKTIDWSKVYRRYGYPNDMLVHLNVNNFRVVDVPVNPIYGIGEKSGIKLMTFVPKVSVLLSRRFFWRLKEKYIIRDFHPLVLFYIFGIALFTVGFIYGLYLLYDGIFVSKVNPTMAILDVLFLTTGLQLMLNAMLQDSEYNKRVSYNRVSS
jgi:glycosyltransferase involved in cell wall biosynthesis